MSVDYQADPIAGEYLYPLAGDPEPRKGAKVQMLTLGGVHITGSWDPRFAVAWLPLPKRNKDKEAFIAKG